MESMNKWANTLFRPLDDVIKTEGFDLSNILLDKKSYKYILIYNISCKIFIGPKPLHIRFDKIDGHIYNGTIYLVLFGPEKYDAT